MPSALDEEVRRQVWRLCLSGETRNNIAEICGIGAGSVTNIINEKTNCLDGSEYGAIRDLAVRLKKEGLTFADLAAMYRRQNYIVKLGATEEEIEVLIANLLDKTKAIQLEKTADLVNQLYELSKSESIPPTEVPAYINQKIKEKQKLEEEIQNARAILDQENIEVQNINEYKKSKEQLEIYGLSTEVLHKLVSVLQSINEMGYDPQKIVAYYTHIRSLEQKERLLKKNCKVLESRAARYQEIFPVCEHVVSMGIGLPLVLTLETAVIKKIEEDCVLPSIAPYRVMREIDDYNTNGGMNKHLNDTFMKVQMMNLVSARQNTAIMTLARLQFQGITESQILNACRLIEMNGYNSNGTQR